jgi:hypothetical protein
MPEYRLGYNDSLTEIRIKTLRRFVKAQEAELHAISTEIHDEENQLEMCNNAIFNLELAIPEGKQIIKATEDNLTSFIDIQSRLSEIKVATQKAMKNESTTQNLYTELRSWTDKSIMRVSDLIDNQIIALKRDVRTLWDKVCQLEMELSGWKSCKGLSETSIKHLGVSRSGLETELEAGKQAFRPIWKIPSDVWTKIFEHVIQQAKDAYLKDKMTSYGMRPPIFNLSQVCQRWRYLMQNDPKSWQLVYVAPYQVWRQNEYDLVTESIQRSNVPITMLTNLSQSFFFHYNYNICYDQNGMCLYLVSPDESTMFNGKDYTLLVNMNDDDSTSMSRLSYLPLRQTSSLIFHGRYNFSQGYLFHYMSNFPNVKSFSIINDNPSYLPDFPISSYFPQLREFAIQVKAFPPYVPLNNYLPSTLQEIQLRSETGTWLPTVTSNITLPHL